ncbi:MAG TPA: protein kinase [Micromonosporaceae bacterium]|nr:protein kinase [Micromonosporaceae bacterium]
MSDSLDRLTAALADRYRLERELGAGGMATVYLAHDLKHERQVAIKVLRPELAAVIGAERFLSEIKTTANLQHPHILPLFDSGIADSFLFYVMPFIEGESLRDRLNREKQLPIGDAIRIATEIAGALDYAHRHNVIHRDIKPENILLHDGRALVADFGIALAASKAGGSRMTETGMSLGTPTYMSPEQAMGEREITARSDVYALGCVLYEMLIGEPPFNGPTAQAIVAKVMTAEPTSLAAQRKSIPPQVEGAVFTALEKLPADRFATAAEFAAALAGDGTTARRHGGTRVTGPAARPPNRLTALLAGIAILATALALWGWLRPTVEPETSRQQVTLWRHSLGSLLSPGVSRIATQAAIAPDGSSIVFADPANDSSPLRRKLRGEADSRPLAGTEGGISPFFSPDGRWVGFMAPGGRLRKVPVEGGAPITLATDGNWVYPSAAWLDDGRIIYVGAGAGFRQVSSDGGASRVLGDTTTNATDNSGMLSPLPGSRGVLYTSCPGNCAVASSVHVFDPATDSSRLLVDDAAGAWYSPTGHLLYGDRSGALFAAAIDLKRLALTSGAVPVIEDVLPGSVALSASGSLVYAVATGGSVPTELVWVSRQGQVERVDSSWRADFQYPAVSPDGKSLAVSVRDGPTQIWIRRADGTRQQLTDSGSVNWRPSWAADSRSIVFLSNRRGAAQGGYDAYQSVVDGSAPARLLLDYHFGLWEAELTPDNQWLVVRSDEESNLGRIRARRLTGDTTLVPQVVDQYLNNNVALSPDGHWLAYTSNRSGRKEVYVAPFPSATSARLVSRYGGSEVRWARSGRELFYKGEREFMVVPITPGAVFVAGTPRPLFDLSGFRAARNRPQYDVSPDGQRFLMIREPSDEETGKVVYVEHWFPELRGKVRAKE